MSHCTINKVVPAENIEQDFKQDQEMKTEYNQEQECKTVFHKKCHTKYKENRTTSRFKE